MRGYYTLLGILVFLVPHALLYAQPIEGHVLDVDGGKPMHDVDIHNIYTDEKISTNDAGHFALQVEPGQLIEFRQDGYKVLRVRIPRGKLPSYFKVMMEKKGTDVVDYVNGRGAAPDYKTDSMRYYALYKQALEYPRLTGIDVVQHPFSAMSKKNRQIWVFQDEYEFYQQQKYIDYTFNRELVNKVSGLKGDSLDVYMTLFRPTYPQLRNMNEYTYYNYIKSTVDAYRKRGINSRHHLRPTPN